MSNKGFIRDADDEIVGPQGYTSIGGVRHVPVIVEF